MATLRGMLWLPFTLRQTEMLDQSMIEGGLALSKSRSISALAR